MLVCEDAPPELLAVLQGDDDPGHPLEVDYRPDLHAQPDALRVAVSSCDGLVVRNRTRVDDALLDAGGSRLRVVGRLGAGLDNVDVAAARRRGIEVVYAPWANSASVAEHALGLILALARRLTALDAGCRSGRWDRDACGTELRGRTLGILGYGAVGRHLALAAGALGMRVITHHPRRAPDHPDLVTAGVQWVDEEALLRQAEILSVHLPQRPDTENYLDRRRLGLLPPGALLVNTGRGGVIDETALADALRSGRLGGAALDVRAQEPPPQPDPLAALDNVLLTPHVGGLTAAAQARVGRQVGEDIRRVLGGLPPLRPAPA
ncbi:MAG TPA: hydroxyacid dehydrogenase [Bacillota bacterium]